MEILLIADVKFTDNGLDYAYDIQSCIQLFPCEGFVSLIFDIGVFMTCIRIDKATQRFILAPCESLNEFPGYFKLK